jgi:hypothetical protein
VKIALSCAAILAVAALLYAVTHTGQDRPGTLAAGVVPKFESYKVQWFSQASGQHLASIEEFFALVGAGSTEEQARRSLERVFNERVSRMARAGEAIPAPGSGRAKARFASTRQIEALGPFVDQFWSGVLGSRGDFKFISDETTLSEWENTIPGGRDEVIRRTYQRYGFDISPYYDGRAWEVLKRIKDARR